MKKNHLFAFVALLCNLAFAQGNSAVPFLTLQPSPLFEGTGRIGAAVPSQDALGFYYNPAQLGYFSRENNLGFSMLPKADWVSNLMPGVTLQSYGIAAGYNFNKSGKGIPLSIGVGFIHGKMVFGEYIIYDQNMKKVENYDSYNCFSVGASYDYYLLFNLGFSIKPFKSELGISGASSTAFDLGAMVIAPVSKLWFDDLKYQLDDNSYFKPAVDFTLGYSLTNLGKEISYVDASQKDPIPRTARLGYSFDFGLDLFVHEKNIRVFDYTFTAEADDELIKNNYPEVEYKGILGDISFGKNLVVLKSNDDVVIHRGHSFRLFESFIFTFGRITGGGYSNVKSGGMGISSQGIFKLIGLSVNNSVVEYITDHFVIEYYNMNEFIDSGFETNLRQVAVNFKSFSL